MNAQLTNTVRDMPKYVRTGDYRVTLTADDAACWLREHSNPKNRKVSKAEVEALARDMLRGVFETRNGQTIAIDTNGVIIDAHHRLEAQVAAGVTLTHLVVFGAVAHGIDRGRSRTCLQERLMRGEKASGRYVQAIRFLYGLVFEKQEPVLTDDDLIAFEEICSEECAWLKKHASRGGRNTSLTAPVTATLAFAYAVPALRPIVETMIEQMFQFEPPNKAVTNFLRLKQDMKTSAGWGARLYSSQLTASAIRSVVRNDGLKKFEVSAEAVPWIRSLRK